MLAYVGLLFAVDFRLIAVGRRIAEGLLMAVGLRVADGLLCVL